MKRDGTKPKRASQNIGLKQDTRVSHPSGTEPNKRSDTMDRLQRHIVDEKIWAIEVEHDVQVVYAVESGSRAWGFASEDSDYDLRFLYRREPFWYIRAIDSKFIYRDVIEYEIDEYDVDASGWDIQKAFFLARKSNPVLFEWLNSPIIYREFRDIMDFFRVMTQPLYSRKSAIYHYLHMARGNFREFLKGDEVRLKKYFYVLRPILACEWLLKRSIPVSPPPVLFSELVEDSESLQESPAYAAVRSLMNDKMAGKELDSGPRIDAINDYLQNSMETIRAALDGIESQQLAGDNADILNRAFRKTLTMELS